MSSTTRSNGASVHQAAIFIPIRYTSSGIEVLACQNEVYNYLRNADPLLDASSSRIATMRWPGEFRFPGGRQMDSDHSPLQTCLRNLHETIPGIRVPGLSDVKATLFQRSVVCSASWSIKEFHVYTFVAFVQENPWLNVDVELINRQLAEKRQFYDQSIRDGTLDRIKTLNLKIHAAQWMSVSELISRINQRNQFVNEWQEQEFKKYNVTQREIPLEEEGLLRSILKSGTKEQIMADSLETVIQKIAATKQISDWRDALFDRDLTAHVEFNKVNELNLLSFNLNILPRGVFAGRSHGHASERLEFFISASSTLKYDVLAMQEIFSSPFLPGCRQRYFVSKMKEAGFIYSVTSTQPGITDLLFHRKVTDGGLVVLSKFPIVDHKSIAFKTRAFHIDRGASKGCLYAKINFGNRYLLVFNTHLQASHVGASQVSSIAVKIRKQQLGELRRFIDNMCHSSPGCPWVLTGDLNIDAIPNHSSNVVGYSFDNSIKESKEYLEMLQIMSPDGSIVDLLKAKYGSRQPSTRPPRLQFPTNVNYMLYHKYPQRLDYVLFTPGSLGEMTAVVSRTRIEKFQITEMQKHSLITRPRSGIDCRRVVHPFDSLSDHYGLGVTLQCENTVAWRKRIRNEEGNVIARAAATDSSTLSLVLLHQVRVIFLALICTWVIARQLPFQLVGLDSEMASLSPARIFMLECLIFLCFMLLLLREFLMGWPKRLYNRLKQRQAPVMLSAPWNSTRPKLDIRLPTLTSRATEDNAENSDRSPAVTPVRRLSWTEDPSKALAVDSNLATLFDIFLNTVQNFGYRECCGVRPHFTDGSREAYEWFTYDQIFRRVERFGSGLVQLLRDAPLRRQDRIGILSENRVEWLICDQACFAFSLVTVPLFVTGSNFLQNSLLNADIKLVVCSRRWTERVIECAERCPALRAVVQMERLEYEEMQAAEKANLALYEFGYVEKKGECNAVLTGWRPVKEDIATIVITAPGSSPVGCILSHANLAASVSAMAMVLQTNFSEEDVHFSFSPLAHITDRIMLLFAISKGMAIGFSQPILTNIFADMQVLEPTFLVGSPCIFDNLYRNFQRISRSWGVCFRWLFAFAYRQKCKALNNASQKDYLSFVYDIFIFRRIARIMGGNLRFIITDGVLDKNVHAFLQICFCCPILQGMVLPEGSGLIALGSGQPEYLGYSLPCTDVKLEPVSDFASTELNPNLGQLYIRGPALFQGYWNKKAKQLEEGWWPTGNICSLNNDGSLTAFGALKDLVIIPRDTGPSILLNLGRLESIYVQCEFVNQIWLCTSEPCLSSPSVKRDGRRKQREMRPLGKSLPKFSLTPSHVDAPSFSCETKTNPSAIPSESLLPITPRLIISPCSPSLQTPGVSLHLEPNRLESHVPFRQALIASIPPVRISRSPGSRLSCLSVDPPEAPSPNSPDMAPEESDETDEEARGFDYESGAECKTGMLPLKAIVSVDHEQLHHWANLQKVNAFDLDHLCKLESAQAAVLECLRVIAVERNLRQEEFVSAVHLVPFTFNTQNKLTSATFELRRPALRKYFARMCST